jgi:hypothetical protein
MREKKNIRGPNLPSVSEFIWKGQTHHDRSDCDYNIVLSDRTLLYTADVKNRNTCYEHVEWVLHQNLDECASSESSLFDPGK